MPNIQKLKKQGELDALLSEAKRLLEEITPYRSCVSEHALRDCKVAAHNLSEVVESLKGTLDEIERLKLYQ